MTDVSETVDRGYRQEIVKLEGSAFYVRIDTGPNLESALLCVDDGEPDTIDIAKFVSLSYARGFIEFWNDARRSSPPAPVGEGLGSALEDYPFAGRNTHRAPAPVAGDAKGEPLAEDPPQVASPLADAIESAILETASRHASLRGPWIFNEDDLQAAAARIRERRATPAALSPALAKGEPMATPSQVMALMAARGVTKLTWGEMAGEAAHPAPDTAIAERVRVLEKALRPFAFKGMEAPGAFLRVSVERVHIDAAREALGLPALPPAAAITPASGEKK